MQTLYRNGKIYVEKGVFVEAMLVQNGKIIQVGETKKLQTNAVKEVDLQGKTVLPGFNDSHLHLYLFGDAINQVELGGAKSIDEAVSISRNFIEDQKLTGEDVLQGRGWNQDYFETGESRLLERKDLDRISTDIPIIMDRVCGHVIVLNSKALELLNMPKDVVIEGGEIRRDENGEPNGIFTENAMGYAKSILPKETKASVKKKFMDAVKYATSCGVTSVQSCDVMGENWEVIMDTLIEIYKTQESKIRYYSQFNFQTLEGVKKYIKEYYRRDELYNDTFQRGAWKLFKDGSLGGRTALLKEPYHDDPTTKGVSALSDELLETMCTYAEEKGIRMITHAIGDEAVQSMIDAHSKTMKPGNPLRHGIVHNQITSMEQLQEIAKNQMTVMYQPIFLQYDIMIIEDRVGKDLAKTSYAFNSMYQLDHKLTSFGTDSPVEDLNPFPNIYCAVNRKRFNGFPEGGYYPEECMTVEEAIDCYTIGSAYSEGNEHIKGRLKEGYFADFIVLDRDIFTIDPMEIKDIKVEATYIGGEKIYKI